MDPVLERAIAERSTQQLGLITDPQLRELGVSSRQRARLTTGGWLVPMGVRTHRVGGAPVSYQSQVLAACLDLDAVASHRTGAFLHRLPVGPWMPVPIEVSLRRGQRAGASPLAIVHTSTNLPPDDIVQIGPIPVTSIARTVLGLAALVPEISADDVRDVVDVAVRDRLASDDWLWWFLEQRRCRGRNGVSTLEGILVDRLGHGCTESWLERAFLRVVDEGGFVPPVVQRRIRVRGAFVARVDTIWPPDIVAEVNGARAHTTRRQQAADAVRRNRLVAAGFRVLEFTYDQVVHDRAGVWSALSDAGVPRRTLVLAG
jgi:hypothetical protein